MSLLDALLLDAYRTNLWIACRTDGVAGSGTQSDPLDGSTQAKFDAIMNALPMQVPEAQGRMSKAEGRKVEGRGRKATVGYVD